MTATASLTLTLLHALVILGVAAAIVGIVAVGTALSPRPAVRTARPGERRNSAHQVATAH
jgi:hypothetical protein